MKKVLVFGITENPGGVESVIMNYYRNIDRTKIQFDFLCNTDVVAYEDEILKLGGKIYRITARSKDRKKYKSDMKNFFENYAKEYNSIWVNVCSLANIDYLKFAKKYGIKKRIIHSHNSQNMDTFLRGVLHKWNRMFIKRYATDFWSCSEDASNWFYNKKIMRNKNNYMIVKNAINIKEFEFNENIRKEYREKLGIEDKFVIGHVGRFHFQKNHIFLIKIFNEIQKKKKNAVLLLIGDGIEKNRIISEVQKYHIEDKVFFLGIREDVAKLMQAMDIFILPSVFEGLGIVAIEAQVAGLPVFASDKVIPNEANIDNEIFEFIDLKNNEEYWANEILKNLNKTRKRKSNLHLFEQANYSIEKEVKKIGKNL